MFTILFVFFVAVPAYIATGVLFSHVQAKLINEKDRTHPAVAIPSALWPISTTVWLFIAIVKAMLMVPNSLISKVTSFVSSRSVKKEEELFEGVQRPALILAKMVATRILQDFSNLRNNRWYSEGLSLNWNERTYYDSDKPENLVGFEIKARGKTLDISNQDKQVLKVLRSAILQARKLKKEKDKADAVAALEHKAVDMIELLVLDPKEKQVLTNN